MTFNLMVQGTTSDAGKSVLVAGICRVLSNRGNKVAPFKPQNMALNSAVTEGAGEIGRAQYVQAQACRVEAHTDMNPVLIKPSSDTGAQIIIHGRALKNMDAVGFHHYKTTAMEAVMASYTRLTKQFSSVIIEGAGSPAEINLRQGDIANMGFAEKADCPVIIVADIDKGGVFAHLVGTLSLLSSSEQNRVLGFVINKFRGDIALLEPGLKWLEERTGKPVFGVLPYLKDFYLEAEDAIDSAQHLDESKETINVVVPVLSRISNHTDFDVLRLHPQVSLTYISPKAPLPDCDLVILPGSKNVRQDFEELQSHNWQAKLSRHLRYGGKLLGICGGYQMLGEVMHDPHGIEGDVGSTDGFGWLSVESELAAEKTLTRVQGKLTLGEKSVVVKGYEIHNGKSQLVSAEKNTQPIQLDNGQSDGCISEDNQVVGTYLHGIFDSPEACEHLLQWAGLSRPQAMDIHALRDEQIERLATNVEQHLDLDALFNAANEFCQNREVVKI